MYWGGLSGAFLLDDTPNLNVIAQLPANPSLSDIFNLATTGFAGVFGRSVSIFSFLLQHESWPDPRNFKFVNLLIHLVNGCLLALCCVLIGRQWRSQSIPLVAIAVISFIWLAHPIQVSSVLYVVQRMTLLSATFGLLALLFYLLGRRFLVRGENARGIFLVLLGLVPVALLSVLSKENGVLVYLYVLVLEYTLFANSEQPKLLLRLRQGLLAATVLIGVAGLIFIMPSTLEGYDLKPFSFAERVLTQFQVLTTYLANIAILLPNYFGVFHDDFANAQGLSLILSMLFVFGLIVAALIKREKWPLFAFAVLWFFAGHALESTFLPLEYYFEHRNYLPLLGLVFALVVYLSDLLPQLDGNKRKITLTIASIAIAFMSITTVRQTALWGDALYQAYAVVEQHPASKGAQSNLVEKLSADGQFQLAFDYHMTVIDPEQLSIPPFIRWLEFSCILPSVEPPEDDVLRRQAREAPHDNGAVFSLNNLVFGILEGRCPSAPVNKIQLVLDELAANPYFELNHADIIFYQALLQASAENFPAAADLAADSFRQRADVRVGLYQVNWRILAGEIEIAISTLQSLERDYAEEIAASIDLSARLQFLRNRLQSASRQ
ncbi:MAG: hypothetical protein COB20_09295 [SAR86 cluster bacterium]|uniref:Uncharacterized protein n=1 Tax=SAR86 cluster bacterium TaxID=2030880 RepID=A0A2A4X3A9_9GAMM|nr:MAG: hypothetical protein COB20_09295 [SAR86 cluster bacterium]